MRQGGFKPKSHNSGTYWVRANAKTGGRKKGSAEKTAHEEDLEGDYNGDGVVDEHDDFYYNFMRYSRRVGYAIGFLIFVIWLNFMFFS